MTSLNFDLNIKNYTLIELRNLLNLEVPFTENEIIEKTDSIKTKIITETNDGFVIAEEDLKLRGPGDILGLSQTGQPSFTFFDLLANEELQDEAERLAQEVIKLPVEQQRKIVERWFPAHLELSDV